MSNRISALFVGGQECGNHKEVDWKYDLVVVTEPLPETVLSSRGDLWNELGEEYTYTKEKVIINGNIRYYFKLSTLSYLEERELLCKYFNIEDY